MSTPPVVEPLREARSLARMLRGARIAALASAALAAGCRRPAPSGASALDGATSSAPTVLPWVDPSRCVSPCNHDPPRNTVTVDDAGQLSEGGRFRFDAKGQPALASLVAAAREAGQRVAISSAYRTHDEQARLHEAATDVGRAARPGHSEHELGLAVDLDYPDDRTAAWLAEHGPEHGFVVSYPDGKQKMTGFRPEPWHLRYVGVEVARAVAASGQTLQEYFAAHPGLGVWGDCADCQAPAARSSCGDVTERGACAGAVLTWCMRGARASVDCASAGRTCGLRDERTGYDCL